MIIALSLSDKEYEDPKIKQVCEIPRKVWLGIKVSTQDLGVGGAREPNGSYISFGQRLAASYQFCLREGGNKGQLSLPEYSQRTSSRQ